MKSLIVGLLLSCMSAHAALPKGNAAWVYNGSEWVDTIRNYNGNTVYPHNLSTIFSYGGGMSIRNGVPTTTFPLASQQAAASFKQVYGVKSVVLTIDGAMNGGANSPDLSKLSVAQVQAWADSTAKLYCGFDYVDGVQIDLEPAVSPYINNLLVFLKQLSGDLMLSSNHCLNAAHPSGRSLGFFVGAYNTSAALFTALGNNGYVIMSGYDLSGNPPGIATPPATYGAALTRNIAAMVKNAGSTGHYMIGIPAGASVHEFSTYVPASGATVQGFPQFSLSAPSYLTQALSVINSVKNNTGYLGTSLWSFNLRMALPYGSNNLYYPSTPFQTAGEQQYLQGNL